MELGAGRQPGLLTQVGGGLGFVWALSGDTLAGSPKVVAQCGAMPVRAEGTGCPCLLEVGVAVPSQQCL